MQKVVTPLNCEVIDADKYIIERRNDEMFDIHNSIFTICLAGGNYPMLRMNGPTSPGEISGAMQS